VIQGIGQALMERTVYDPQGQPLAGSYMDYAMPRAADAPDFSIENHSVPCKTNRLGVKGCGEAGCAGALPSVMNAVVDALSGCGVTHVDMPVTPEKVWRILHRAWHLSFRAERGIPLGGLDSSPRSEWQIAPVTLEGVDPTASNAGRALL
jgi:xanthine dehydrogenase molybdopterin-binding subunit B